MKSQHTTQSGFTLIETMVAIAIFASAITGLIAITASGVANTNFVKNKFTAGYLALEGAELVHNIRDTASISNPINVWNDTFSAVDLLDNCTSPDASKACYIDTWTPDPPQKCTDTNSCPYMTFDKQNGQFSYHNIDNINYFNSIFKRTITVQTISPTEVRVVSRVDWLQGAEPHNVTYAYDLSNWTSAP